MIKAFPKIFTLGQDCIKDLLLDEIEITEKIDGSQFNFGKIDDIIYFHSKGAQIFPEHPDSMFKLGVDYVMSICDKLRPDCRYHAEYLRKPKHNVLCYERVPKNNLILFGMSTVGDSFCDDYDILKEGANELDIDVVPLLFKGKISSIEFLHDLFETESYLGGTKIEGVVIKNYHRPFMLGNCPIPVMMGKYVSEKFKEVHRKEWKQGHTSVGQWELFKQGYQTEARWQKAIQHLDEKGELEHSPRDIGKLLKEVQNDIAEEEKETIKEFLWKHFGQEVLKRSTIGFPEWYKMKLVERQNV